jgi:hypothetical protein
MMEKSTRQTSLTKFKDCLRMPIILRPHKTDDQRYSLRIQMPPAQVQLHSELPPSEVWVQPLSVVDNLDISPTGLTAWETRPILASRGALPAPHF